MVDEARAALAWADQGGAAPAMAIAMAGLLADILFQRGQPAEAQRRYQQAAALTSEPRDRCRWLRLAAGAAAARNVGDEAVDLLEESAETSLACGAADDAADDLASRGAPVPGARHHPPSDRHRGCGRPARRARAITQGGAGAEAAIAVAAGWDPDAAVRSVEHTETALRLARHARRSTPDRRGARPALARSRSLPATSTKPPP